MQEQTKRRTFEENVCGGENNDFWGYLFIYLFTMWKRAECSKNWNYFKLNMDFLLRKQFPFLEKGGI